MRLWMMVKSGIRKNKSSSITLMVLIMIATIFLNLGLNVITKLDSFVDHKDESLNGADFVVMGEKQYQDEVIQTAKEIEGYQDDTVEDAVIYDSVSIYNAGADEKPQSMGIVFLDMDKERKYSILEPLYEQKEVKENSIIMPYSLKSGYDYEVGDTVEIIFDDKKYEFEIYAFSEDIMFATPMNISIYKCFIPHAKLQEIYESVGEKRQQFFLNVGLKEGYDSESYEQAFTSYCSANNKSELLSCTIFSSETMKVGVSATVEIIMAMLVVFAILLIVISMVVIRFSIASYIEEDIKNLGSMEAVGFTSGMIQKALIAQFALIATIGFFLGTIVSFLGVGVVSMFVETSIGLVWTEKITMNILLITFATLMILITGVTFKVSRRIRKVTPIMALRNGIETYHFGKNHLPLATTHGNLHWILGLKGIFQNGKQNIAIGIIVAITSFSISFALSMYNSLVAHPTAFFNIIGIEKPELTVTDPREDYLEFFDQLSTVDGVRKTLRYSNKNITLKNGSKEMSTAVRICNDYSEVETDILGEGKNPEYDNEIAISYNIMEKLKIKLGEVIHVVSNGTSYEYIVVGYLQHICYLGDSVSLTEAGMKRCNSTFCPNQLNLYLEDGYDTKEMYDKIKEEVISRGGLVVNMEESFDTTLNAFSKGITLVCVVVCIITGIVTVLILYYLVKMKITKERINFGIQKAVGFTTGQLMSHTVISFLPVVTLSSLLGIVLAYIGINPMTALIIGSISSIKKCNFEMNPWMTVISIIAIILLAAMTTMLVSFRIRKVQARDLVAE